MAHLLPTFERYFLSEKFSDVDVEVLEELEQSGQKRKRGLTIPGHSMVLVGFSAYCSVKLENWNQRDSCNVDGNIPSVADTWSSRSTKHSIQLPVPAGQTELAKRLIKGMYDKQPQLSDLSQQQLIALLLLADRFEVPKVQIAALDVFRTLSIDDLQWDTALSLLDLPSSFSNLRSCKQVCELAIAKVMQKLADLEEVWADKQLQDELLSLPHAALLRLVQHDELRAFHERTVVYTILQWWDRNKSLRTVTTDHLKQLMQEVRMQHLSQLYISTVLACNQEMLSCYSTEELFIACLCTEEHHRKTLREAKCVELIKYPAWTAAKRAASGRKPVLEWDLPLTELQRAFQGVIGTTNKATISSEPIVMYGLEMKGIASIVHGPADECASFGSKFQDANQFQFGLYLDVLGSKGMGICCVNFECIMLAQGSAYVPGRTTALYPMYYDDIKYASGHCGVSRQGVPGDSNMLRVRYNTCWEEVEAAFRHKRLVHAGDELHIVYYVSELL